MAILFLNSLLLRKKYSIPCCSSPRGSRLVADIENCRLSPSFIKYLTIVDLPVPEGAEKIISLLMFMLLFLYTLLLLQHVKYLFFNLFKFIFHLNYNSLHIKIVRFRTKGINLTTYLLSYETKLFTL